MHFRPLTVEIEILIAIINSKKRPATSLQENQHNLMHRVKGNKQKISKIVLNCREKRIDSQILKNSLFKRHKPTKCSNGQALKQFKIVPLTKNNFLLMPIFLRVKEKIAKRMDYKDKLVLTAEKVSRHKLRKDACKDKSKHRFAV